ncbi:MAG: DUF2284 domain-containing protein [Clostridia bacterium]|nr:DUF2284 domain-containing protein [Clostridia bacterium]
MNNNALFDALVGKALACGADRAAVIDASALVTDTCFRDMCAANACGVYGKCYMCPPDVGDVNELMQSLTKYAHVLVYQRVSALEDSFDFEGMQAARRAQYRLAQALRDALDALPLPNALHLGAGGCGVCQVCAKRTNEPCRFPDRAMASLEAYGIHVSEMARAAGMNYINGENTVTYFGAVLFGADAM